MKLKTKIKRKLIAIRERKIAKYTQELREQRHPLDEKQYKKLIRLLPRDKYICDWLDEWVQEDKRKREIEEAIFAKAITKFVDAVKSLGEQERIRQEWYSTGLITASSDANHKPAKTELQRAVLAQKRKSIFVKSSMGALLLVAALLASYVIPNLSKLFNNGGSDNLPISAPINMLDPPTVNIVKYHEEDVIRIDVYASDIYNELLQDDEVVAFKNVILRSGFKEVYKNNKKNLFSDSLTEIWVDASIDYNNLIIFDIDYSVRYERNYESRNYEQIFEPMLYNQCQFSIGSTHIFYSTITITHIDNETTLSYNYLTFSYLNYDYFLTIRELYLQDIGGIATELNDNNIKLLMHNLLG